MATEAATAGTRKGSDRLHYDDDDHGVIGGISDW
jgi:hypothetical protein